MIFTSFDFVIFFFTVLLLRAGLGSGAGEKWLLLVASLCFYISWSLPCVILILFVSVVDYSIGRKLGQTTVPASRRRLLVTSLVVNLGLLGFFKYTNFLLENVSLILDASGWRVGHLQFDLVLPPAISYFTFASMSYIIDVYYERSAPCGCVRDYALFVTFFPKLLSGPIVRAREFLPQLEHRVRANMEDIETGVTCFLVGAVKKLVIADQVAGNVNLIFSAPGQYDGLTLLQGLLGYAIQIYCDFSGYSDMAIGCARILGFKFPENFQMPFSAVTITEFWRRWHITMSQWFRDYVFLPLEMATRHYPNAILRSSINMSVTMLLCGLWHGASWNFVIWGTIHGAALSTHKIWTTWNPLASFKSSHMFQVFWSMFSRMLTLGVILLSFVFFRAQSFSHAFAYLSRMLLWSHDGVRLWSPYIVPATASVLLVHLLVGKDRNWVRDLLAKSVARRTFAYTCLVMLLVFLGATDAAPFIYFQF